MQSRTQHQAEVEAFLRRAFHVAEWTFSLPRGSGHETYFARSGAHALFVKLGTSTERVLALSHLSVTPTVLEAGRLADGTTIVVQPQVDSHNPRRADYRELMEQIATTIRKMHHSDEVKATLTAVPSVDYASAGSLALGAVRKRWEEVREQVPNLAQFVDTALDALGERITRFTGSGPVASHSDICSANWLLAPNGRLYLIDLDAMGLDDPALDVGATLWWYYPQEMWSRFLRAVGYPDNSDFRERMWARLALHCLSIILPRPGSFDTFDPVNFAEALVDFRSALGRQENPKGHQI